MTLGLYAATPARRAGARQFRTSARALPPLLVLAWAGLFLNVLAPSGNATVLPIPPSVAKAVAQASLYVALVALLLLNRRCLVRPNTFMTLLTVMALASFAVSLHSEFFLGSTFRAVRLVVFVGCLWLLTPWWGRSDLLLLRVYRLCLWAALTSVVIGALLGPGKAFSFEGRLAGALWPMPPTQVAHYAGVLFGTSVVLWFCKIITGRHALAASLVSVAVLVGTHTRTALMASLIGVAVAGASLFLGHARVRRVSLITLVTSIAGGVLFAPVVVSWLSRGQSAEDAAQLTGRTKVWTDVFTESRSWVESLFGSGLSNKSFDGLAVDSNWVASYLDQGWLGIVLQATMLLTLLAMAVTRTRGPRRAVALFLIVYCIVASVTETGLGDASPYLLDLVVAGSLLVAPARGVSS